MSVSVVMTGSSGGTLVRCVCEAVISIVEIVSVIGDSCATSVSPEKTTVAVETGLIQIPEGCKAVDDDAAIVLASSDGSHIASSSSSETLKYPVS